MHKSLCGLRDERILRTAIYWRPPPWPASSRRMPSD